MHDAHAGDFASPPSKNKGKVDVIGLKQICADTQPEAVHQQQTSYAVLAEEAAAAQAARRADKLSSKMKKSLQARADKAGSLGCKVALTHFSRKGRLSQIASASLSEALEACTPEQQLALQQELQKGPEKLLQLLRVCCSE